MTNLLQQACEGVLRHWRRSLVAVLSVLLLTCVAIVVPGSSRMARAKVALTFAQSGGRALRVTPLNVEQAPTMTCADVARLGQLPGVRASGAALKTDLLASTRWSVENQMMAVSVACPGLGRAASLVIDSGVDWTATPLVSSATPVALVSARAAVSLGVGPASPTAVIWVDERPYTVIGIFRQTQGYLLGDVLIPEGAFISDFPTRKGSLLTAVVGAEPSDLPALAAAVPTALHPQQPNAVLADWTRPSTRLQDAVESDIGTSTLLTMVVTAGAGAVLVVSLLSSTVASRRSEIGLRFSLGASSRQVMIQFLIEGALLSLLGAGLGCASGVVVLRVVSRLNDWPLHLPEALVLLATGLMGGASLLASVWSAWVATRVDPIDALTSTQ